MITITLNLLNVTYMNNNSNVTQNIRYQIILNLMIFTYLFLIVTLEITRVVKIQYFIFVLYYRV